MIGSDVQLQELIDRLARTERRTQALESMLLHEERFAAPPHETPTPAGVDTPRPRHRLKPPVPGRQEVVPSAILSSLDDAIWSLSPDGQHIYHMIGGVERTFGRSAQEFHSRPGLWFELIADADRDAVRVAFRDLHITETFELEYAIRSTSGVVRWVNSRGRLVRDADGTAIRVDGITTRRKSDRAGLAILEAIGPRTGPAFLTAVVEQLARGFDSRAALIAVPHPADPRTAQALAFWVDGRLADPFPFAASGRFVKDVLAGGSQFIPTAARDRFPDDDLLKRVRAEAAYAVPLIAGDGRLLGFVAVFDDRSVRGNSPDARVVLRALAPRIAVELDHRPPPIPSLEEQRCAAEDRAQEASRFEVVGRLLAGAAHDFNNLLTLVTGHAELVREHLMDSALRESMDVVVSSGHTAARVARQLLGFAKPHAAVDSSAMDPNAAIAENQRMLAQLAGERIELDLLLAPGVAPIRADRTAFDRVVFNLVANAKDAIEESGVITVRTATAQVSADRRGWPAECPPGEYVAVTITDTGCGMTEDVKSRAFTRFFTTKGIRGTGLGLANVLEIVQAAGGHVELDSSTEWGTAVRVFWPAAAEHDEPISLSFEEALVNLAE